MIERRLLVSLIPLLALAQPVLAAGPVQPSFILVRGAVVIDAARHRADIRIAAGRFVPIGRLQPQPGERVIDAAGLVAAPAFIDTHSHADGGLLQDPEAETMFCQGITPSAVGQDGHSHFPLRQWFDAVQARHVTLNIASFVGHGAVRSQAIHKMTSLPAWRIGFSDRGAIQMGRRADLVLFNPATIADQATIAHPAAPPVGLPWVLANGVVVLEKGRLGGARPGMVLRRRG